MSARIQTLVFTFLCATTLFVFPEAASAQLPRILGGEETDDFPAVGIVGSQRRGGFCSGTLISSNHVLTAAHCAEEIESPTSGTFEVDGQVFETSDVIIHPDYNPFTLDNDIAILELSESVSGIEPSLILREAPLVGDVLTIVGFGGTGTATDGSDDSFGTKRFGFTIIDEVTSSLVNWEFDDPTENNTAPGDSGGPGYLDLEGDLFIACITSGGSEPDAALGDMAFNTRVDAFATWIDDVILFSEPPDEPTDEPTDDEDQMDGSDCDFSGPFGHPFPLLRLLLHLLWALMDLLNDDGTDDPGDVEEPAAPSEPTEPEPTGPTEPEPTGPTEPQPAAPMPEVPVPGDVPEDAASPVVGAATADRGVPIERTRIRRSRNGRLSTGPTWRGRIGY